VEVLLSDRQRTLPRAARILKAIARRVREISRKPYVIWGGIHPIIHPEDAIRADVDAICTGEGEFAYERLLESLQAGRDVTDTRNFWFRQGDEIVRNPFLPLMTSEEMETLVIPAMVPRISRELTGLS